MMALYQVIAHRHLNQRGCIFHIELRQHIFPVGIDSRAVGQHGQLVIGRSFL
jgi:hypothetical protein